VDHKFGGKQLYTHLPLFEGVIEIVVHSIDAINTIEIALIIVILKFIILIQLKTNEGHIFKFLQCPKLATLLHNNRSS